MNIPYRRLAALALLVFAASQILVLVEVTHDSDRVSQVFLPIIFVIALVIAALAHRFDRWWSSALAFAGAALAILSEATYISHITNFDEAWEFAPISLATLGALGTLLFAGADLVQRRRTASTDAPAALAPAFGVAIAAVLTLIVVSFVITYSSIESVNATERQGATVVRMKEIKFAPRELTAGASEPIRLVVENHDLGSHTFVLKAGGADIDEYFGAGDERLLEFTIAEPGTYEFKCDIEGHNKMKGTVTVQ